MTDYISREAARELLVSRLQETALNNTNYLCDAGTTYMDAADRLRLCWIDKIPAADVRPVVRGKWISKYPLSTCSVCEESMILCDFANFCPNCGADMRPPKEE